MTTFGYFLSSEEHDPRELVRQARLAEQAGFESLWISDHFHPWLDEQGQSPFVWSVIGAIAEATSLPITTAVTCPLVRIHPAIIAQAAATSAVLTGGRFRLGVGTGEALNEHIIDSRWPPAEERLEMLEEAVEIMRELWSGRLVTHRGTHYDVDTARLYTLPDSPPPIYMSGFGEKSVELAGRIADGYICTGPSAEFVQRFHDSGGQGKPVQGGLKVCYAADEATARKTVHRLWPTQGIQGEAAQLLPLPRHFEQLAQMVTEEEASKGSPCGPDPEVHLKAIREYVDAGFDEVYVSQIGDEQEAFFDFYAKEVLPRLR
ncbi:LLM class F420-dependent oxidoreductase [Planomonospora sp. ID91781]|uniref:LLM class F420-dependent oxidoreductase n=2 Tax=Planomonospora parontospora TaxID=58119 RepID=A0AA37BK32_9ACTN|nr:MULTISPECIES: LLM class F420-dependent oxidoreductase [Planomonospora]MBG0822424.1 LLM class F420-dependent oxidoreductase [Planomonospora sp. ID91781]GGK83015.1 LLM class F420-dependent oxidoreductase [Planomonospora parontospora]GII10411.1 LLM class F420-dependent oxidoreductase [Planomonospora parontospora subsp. parontospora]